MHARFIDDGGLYMDDMYVWYGGMGPLRAPLFARVYVVLLPIIPACAWTFCIVIL